MNRRRFLTGAALGAAAMPISPLMRSVMAEIEARASGSGKHPLRFVFCIKSNGLWAEMVQPKGLLDQLPFKVAYDEKGRLIDSDNDNIRKGATPAADLELGKDIELGGIMTPLEPFRDRLSILQGINSGFSTYHMGCYQTLGGFQAQGRNSLDTLGPTVDSLLGHAFHRPVPHVRLGHDPRSPSGVAYVPTSAEAAGKPLPFYTKPLRAYKELFGVIGEGDAKSDYETQSEILDFFVGDTKRIRSNVAAAERDQLDRYLDAFDSVKRSREEVEAMREQLKRFAPPAPAEIDAHSTMRIGEGNTEIAIASLLSGLTNVVTLRFDLLGSSSYEGVGGLHGGVGHGQVKNVLEARRTITGFHLTQIARIAGALKSIPEGDGTMLDNTVIVYTSDNGETHHSSGVNYPVILLGDLGGRLRTRRYFAPGDEEKPDRAKSEYTRLGDVWATLLAASGQPFEHFGIPVNGVPHRPIKALIA